MNTGSGYWELITRRRLTRRRAMIAGGTAGLGLAAISLIGCGGSNNSNSSTSGSTGSGVSGVSSVSGGSSAATSGASGAPAKSSLVSTPVDTTAAIVKGGNYPLAAVRDVASLDFSSSEGDQIFAKYAYSRLVRYKAIKYPDAIRGVPEGDAATSWESSPDGTQITYKLRQGMKFDPRPPTSGRTLNAQDVVFAWKRYEALGTFAPNFVNSKTPSAPFVSMEAPDDSTVLVKLAYPYAPANLFQGYVDFFHIMPVEAQDKYDPKGDLRGTAAWRLDEHVPSARLKFVKNPDWYDAAKVNFDSITHFILPEYASGLAQFRAGSLATFTVAPEDVVQTKKDVSSLLLMADEQFSTSANWLKFGRLPDSPFNDVRVRHAVSMLIDRDLAVKTMYNVDRFAKDGLDVPLRWNSAIPGGDAFWVDPKGTDLGDAAQYYQFKPDEAKKLIQAAGHTSAIDVPYVWSNGYGGLYPIEAEIIANMLEANGDFKLSRSAVDHSSEYRPKILYGKNQHEGLGFGGGGTSDPDVDIWLEKWYRGGVNQSGWPQDPTLDSMIDGQKRETNDAARAKLEKDIQAYVPKDMNFLLSSGIALGFTLTQPWVGNAGLWRSKGSGSPANETYPYLWYDASKA